MITNYSRHDKLRGKEAWGLPICLALVSGVFVGGFKYLSDISRYQTTSPEIRAVQNKESQDFCSRNPNESERLVDKYRRER